MKTRIVHTKIWDDDWFCNLSRPARLLFLYLLTCSQNNICGVFNLPDRVIMFNTGLSRAELDSSKADLVSRVLFHSGWVKILNTARYNNYVTNPNMEKALASELKMVPADIVSFFDSFDTRVDTRVSPRGDTPININKDKSKIKNKINAVFSSKIPGDSVVLSAGDSIALDVDPASVPVADPDPGPVSRSAGVSDSQLEDIAAKFNVDIAWARSKLEETEDYILSHGKKYKDRVAFLRNWIRKDLQSETPRPYSPPAARVSLSTLLNSTKGENYGYSGLVGDDS